MQITMPKSRSLWPLMPRKETWERSGSFKLASPPASSARAEAAPSKDRAAAVAANLANLQVNLQVRDQAFASQVSIPTSSVDHSFRWHSNGVQSISQGNCLPGEPPPAHFFGQAPLGANEEQIVHIPPGRSRRAPVRDYPNWGRRSAPKTRRKGCTKRRFITL